MGDVDLSDLWLEGDDGLGPSDMDGAPPKPKKWQRKFVQLPWPWVGRLRSAKRPSTWLLACLLHYEFWRTGNRPVALSNISAQVVGLSPRSKSNALAELERLGLVRVERALRKSPQVVPLALPTDP
jgi:hypothetical protein